MSRDEHMKHLVEEMRDSIRRSEAAEHTYRAVVAGAVEHAVDRGQPAVIGEMRAASDPRLRSAVGDSSFYRDRAQTYALAILAETALEGGPW